MDHAYAKLSYVSGKISQYFSLEIRAIWSMVEPHWYTLQKHGSVMSNTDVFQRPARHLHVAMHQLQLES